MRKSIIAAIVIFTVAIIYGYWDKSRIYLADDFTTKTEIKYRNDHSGYLDIIITFIGNDNISGIDSIEYLGDLYLNNELKENVSGSCKRLNRNYWINSCTIKTHIIDNRGIFLRDDNHSWINSLSSLSDYEIRNEKIIMWKSYTHLRYIKWIDAIFLAVTYPFTRS